MTKTEFESWLYKYKGKCERVIDGDTIEILFDLGKKIFQLDRGRLKGVDTAEIYGVKKGSEEYVKGMISTNRVRELIENKTVYIESFKDKTGKYGRFVIKLWFVDVTDPESDRLICLNDLLLQEGLAKAVKY